MPDGTTNTSKNPAIKKSSDGERSSPSHPHCSIVLPLNDVAVTLPRRWALEHARVEELAKKRNTSMAQIGLAWTLSKEGSSDLPSLCNQPVLGIRVPCADLFLNTAVTAPIIGTTSLDKLKDLISKTACVVHLRVQYFLMTSDADAIDLKLTEEEIKHLEEAYKSTAVIGHS